MLEKKFKCIVWSVLDFFLISVHRNEAMESNKLVLIESKKVLI